MLTDAVLSFGIFEGAVEKDRPVLARSRGTAAGGGGGGVRGWSLSLSLVVAWLEPLLLLAMSGGLWDCVCGGVASGVDIRGWQGTNADVGVREWEG